MTFLFNYSSKVFLKSDRLESFSELIITKAYATTGQEDIFGILLLISYLLYHFKKTTPTIGDGMYYLEDNSTDIEEILRRASAETP